MSEHKDEVPQASRLQESTNIEGQRELVTTLKTPPFVVSLKELMTTLLTSHGATVEHWADHTEVIFPTGTYRTEILPRLHNEHYRILFPDCFEAYETKKRGDEYSYLQFESSQLSEEQMTFLLVEDHHEQEGHRI